MIKDRVMGSLVGLAVGDALGTTIEFSPRDTYSYVTDIVGGGPFDLQPGEWTDDTSMALCLAESLCDRRGSVDSDHLLQLFADWRDHGLYSVKGHCFDIGNTTAFGIRAWQQTGSVSNNQDDEDSGNGGIMRLAPAAMSNWRNQYMAATAAMIQSATTHGSGKCIDSAEFLARLLVKLYHGDSSRPFNIYWHDDVKTIATKDYTAVPRHEIHSSGYVIHTLEAAVWAVQNSNSFSEAVLLAVNLGGDADTVGAVTGQIAGARWGFDSIPKAWIDRLAMRDLILDFADQLYEIGER